jgi:hypothetical protein
VVVTAAALKTILFIVAVVALIVLVMRLLNGGVGRRV